MNREQTTIRLTLRMPEELERRIRGQADRKGQSINQLMFGAIWNWLNQNQCESDRAAARTPESAI